MSFLTRLGDLLTVGANFAFAGSALALWRLRERKIEREPVEREAATVESKEAAA